jgi:hypothetical protein
MIQWNWFEAEDDEVFGPQVPFLGSVRASADSWEWCEPSYTSVLIDDDDSANRLQLVVDVPDPISGSIGHTLSVLFLGDLIECGEVHTQDYSSSLVDSRIEGLRSAGEPEALGRAAAAWFSKSAHAIQSR